MAEPLDDLIRATSDSLSTHTGEGVVIDLGTGDGRFVYQWARKNPKKFYIGIDANPRPLEKISEKIHRKPAKGGMGNVLFLQASLDDLPSELDGLADEVHVHFPWGSLLRVVAAGDEAGLVSLRKICSTEALLEIIIGIDSERDRSEIERLGLEQITIDYIDRVLATRYRTAGFNILERGILDRSEWPKVETSWAKRLQTGLGREVVYLIAQASVSIPRQSVPPA